MTEREYIETIRKAAEDYVAFLRLNKGPTLKDKDYWRWVHIRDALSPHTAIALCDAWLTMQEAAE